MRIRLAFTVFGLLLLACTQARAETSEVSDTGFLVTYRFELAATPQKVFESIARVDQWWNPEHTWSGDARNLSLDTSAGGCFCERWKAGEVQHARVLMALRDSLVRLEGGLGPLQALGVNGILSFAIKANGDKSQLHVTYRVSGNAAAGLQKLAPAVDQVIGEQAGRLAAYAETGDPARKK